MKDYTVYSPSTGQILRTGAVLKDSDADAQAKLGEAVLVGARGDRVRQRVVVVDGAPTLVAIEQAAPTLGEQKAAAKNELARRRWEVETGGVSVGGSLIATDRESQATINGALTYLSLGLAASVKWKTETGAFVNADLMTVRSFAAAVGAHVQACFAREAELSAEIDAAADADALAAVLAKFATFWIAQP